MKVWIEVYRSYSCKDTFDPYPRRWFAVLKCVNGRKLMMSIGHPQRRHCVILAKKLAKYLKLEYRGRKDD